MAVVERVVEVDTEVVAMEPDRHLELDARAWPTGTARVAITPDRAPGGTRTTMEEGARVRARRADPGRRAGGDARAAQPRGAGAAGDPTRAVTGAQR